MTHLLTCIKQKYICLKQTFLLLFRHGEPWREFRTKVQKPVLQPQTVKKYIQPIEEVSDYFIKRYEYYIYVILS